MKVFCITSKWRHRISDDIFLSSPKYGETCNVIGLTADDYAYLLEEYPHPNSPEFGWAKIGFILLSNINELELVNKKEEVV